MRDMRLRCRSLFGIAAALMAATCVSTSGIALTELKTKATFENAGIRVAYVDDANEDAEITVEYRRKGETEWRAGHPLIRIAGGRFATSLFGLAEETTYQVQLSPVDPDGVSVEFDQPFEITTRSSSFPATGDDLYVDASVDASGDGSRNAPFRTISEASRQAQAGDVVHIMPGVYSEQVTPAHSGTEDAWIHYRGEGEGVVVDGGRTIAVDSGWTDTGDDVNRTPFDGRFNYAALDTVRLYQHANPDELRQDGDGIVGGYAIQDGFLYVKAPDGGTLNDRTLRVAVHEYGFYLNQRNFIVLENLDIGYFDRADLRVRASHHVAIRRCRIHHSRSMVLVDGRESTDNLIEDCTIWGTGVDAWPWEICHHDHDCSSNAISLRDAGVGNVVRRNLCRGVFNGIYLGQWTTDYPEENALENDVYENRLEKIVDDGLEPECKAINLRMYGNRFKKVFSPISLAPIETGPTWVMYNVVDGLWPESPGWDRWGGSPGWIKISLTPGGERPLGALRIYHNTAFIDVPEQNGWSSVGSGYTHFKNNVVSASRYVFENTRAEPFPPGSEWDYNNLYTTASGRYVKWENVRLDEVGFQALGFQRHGISAPPQFVDAERGDFSLRPDDPGIDRGVPLPGINDGYSGDAPDMGAFEYTPSGQTAIEAERVTSLPERPVLQPGFPNPFNSHVTIPFLLPKPQNVELSIFSLSGQRVTTLVDGRLGTGRHTVRWNGRSSAGENQASGVYLYRLRTGQRVETRKLLLVK